MVNPPENLVGKQLGQFTIKEEVGRGGMASVYRAEQQSINRDVALKVLPKAFLHDPGFYERFIREVDVVAHLEHPHIVPIYDFGEAEGMPYIAMRLLMGGSLRSIIKQGSPELRDLIKPVQQIADALDYAHQQGIIHRDLKPGNVLLDTSGNAYLSDFGIARVLNSELTGSAIIGTPAYMSPEQAQGESLDARSDVYSLGVVIFEMITGREPFVAETPIAMILKHLNERVPYISEFRDDIPHEVDKVIAKATEKQKDQRYSSAGALAEAFADAVRGTASTISIPTDERVREQMGEEETLPPPRQKSTQPELDKPTTKFDLRPDITPTNDLNSLTVTPAEGVKVPKQEPSTPFELKKGYVKPQRPSRGRAVALGIAAVILVIIGLLAFNRFTSSSGAAPMATPFVASQTVQTASYAINMPQDWLPPEASYYDIREQGDPRAVLHAWQDVNAEVLVTLALADMGDANFTQMAWDYISDYYDNREGFTPVDNTAFPDGSIRYSYRTTGFLDFPAGQMDVFLLPYGEQFVAIEMYSADVKGNTMVPIFQKVLDSFQLRQ